MECPINMPEGQDCGLNIYDNEGCKICCICCKKIRDCAAVCVLLEIEEVKE